MKEIKLTVSDEDYEFLKELQNELNTQTNDGNADPVFWGVMEDSTELSFQGEGNPMFTTDDGLLSLKATVKELDEYMPEFDEILRKEWEKVDKEDPYEVEEYIHETLGWDFYDLIWEKIRPEISRYTGAFLTKRACKDYIKNNAYHHSNPRTYAMTAFRNYELERFLDIFRHKIKF